MATTAAPLLIVMGWTLIAVFLVQLMLKWNGRRRHRRCAGAALPPGSMGLPLLGETVQYFTQSRSLDLHPFFKQRLERYGPIFKTNLIGKKLIVSLDTELNNYVLQQEEKAFQIWYPESFMRIMGEGNLVTSVGFVHKHIRNMILRVFGPENLRLALLHDVQSEVNKNLASWLDRPCVELSGSLKDDIQRHCKVFISYDASTSAEELWKHYYALIQGLVSFPINIPGTAFYRCMQGRKNIIKALKNLLDERKQNAESGERKDFFDAVIDELKQEKALLNEISALNLLFLLLFASFETTSTAITAALKFLTDNPKALEELAEEHEEIRKRRVDPDSEITWEEYKSMKFTSNVIHESLRLANIATLVFRKAKQDVHIKGYTIPEGWTMILGLSAAHFDPNTYKNPNVFNPWRWKDISEPVGGSKNFVAFGSGLRYCVGADFAKLQMAIFFHCLLTKYRWKVVGGGDMVISPGLRFPKGCHIQLVPKP